MSIYDNCPIWENDRFRLEFISLEHCTDLLKVYSDIRAVPFFNSDNCGGDTFYYSSYEKMADAINYWLWEYSRKGFVRMSVIDKFTQECVGTIEMFVRYSDDYFNETLLLRLDLRSDYESQTVICTLISLVSDNCFDYFDCKSISTKAIPVANERISALLKCGFLHSSELLYGHDGTPYSDYYIFFKD